MAYRSTFDLLSQRLEQCLERERRTHQAHWTLIEDKKMTEARLALFGGAPK
jgi:hypothetical protein